MEPDIVFSLSFIYFERNRAFLYLLVAFSFLFKKKRNVRWGKE